MKYKTVSSETKFSGIIIKTRVDMVRMPDGTIHEREVVEHKGAVGIVPITANREIILVKQYRHPTGDELWEIPAGKLAQGEDPLDCANRELVEETGFSGKLSKAAEFYTTPGYSDEYFYLFLAIDLKETDQKPSDEEIVQLTTVPLEQALEMIAKGDIRDGKSITGIGLAERYLRNLEASR